MLDDVDEALVAVGARLVRAILAGGELLDEVVVGDQRPRHADGVAVASAIALRMTDAVWNPPVQMTGTVTACLMTRASGSVSPSI